MDSKSLGRLAAIASLAASFGLRYSVLDAKTRRTTFFCVQCGTDIPPGRTGRLCKVCRESRRKGDER